MNDRNHDRNPEDRAIEQAWRQVMAAGSGPRLLPLGGPRDSGDVDSELVREYTEVLGLLPYGLAAEVPPAHLKEEIMARVAGVAAELDAGASEVVETAPVVPFRRPAAARETPTFRSAWHSVQTAALAAGLVCLGFLSATVWKQNQQIARLSSQVPTSALYQNEAFRADVVQTLRDRLDMVTTVARQAYPLRTVSRTDSQQQPAGIVYVCGRHQRWYLSLRGLTPPAEGAEGGEYRLWFMTDDGKVDGGVLEVRSDTSSEMEAQTMPPGTRGFLVTLEKRDEPESLTVLLGESAINL